MPYTLSGDFEPTLKTLLEASSKREESDYAGALEIYETLDESSALLATRAFCHFKLAFEKNRDIKHNYSRAITLLKKAITLDPTNSMLYTDLAFYFMWGLVKYEEALEAYRSALEIDPNNYDALVGAASLYDTPEDIIELDEAIEFLERAAKLRPGEQYNWYNLALLYQKAENVTAAEKALARSLLCPKSIEPEMVEENWLDPE
jgi:tetratricopeptide (TPR) repeat protein